MKKSIVLAGGCFWGVEKYFSLLKGVTHTEVAYANGNTENPNYHQVCSGSTNHAEAVLIEYNSEDISLAELLEYFYAIIDPTSLNKQGNDQGTQYRTGIYYKDESDKIIAENSLIKLQEKYDKPILIELELLKNYYVAEEYHQDYLNKNPNGYCHISQEKFNKVNQRK